MPHAIRVNLVPEQFAVHEQVLLESGEFAAESFRFSTGVCGLRLRNSVGEIVLLPWQGQQIWSARFHGRDLTMVSMFDAPVPTREYLSTYGAFLLHCGATAMGGPGPEDSHPLHGELPNAPYRSAFLQLGSDERGSYLALGGLYRHTVAFSANYTAEPLVKLRPGSALLDIDMVLTNLMRQPMNWMYLGHLNFRPVAGARLVYSAPCDREHIRVRQSVPAHISTPAGYREFLAELAADPAKHNIFSADMPYNPEVCLYIDYLADEQGWAHSMQVHPDGSADYVSHRPEQLDKVVRWIANTGDQAAMGLVLPATAEPEGFHAEQAKGNIRILGGHESIRLSMRAGALRPSEVAGIGAIIDAILA